MTLKVGGLYATITERLVHITHVEFSDNRTDDGYYRGVLDTPSHFASSASIWYQNGKYVSTADFHVFDLVEEVTDPVILAFYQK